MQRKINTENLLIAGNYEDFLIINFTVAVVMTFFGANGIGGSLKR